ncbi:MAG: acyltransferase [Chloroflexi bacterium]|nr:acyltransferase [Chloroflexota bacterium]
MGDPKSLDNMLRRSFGATSFAGFWQYWNPIWGYGLGKYVNEPTRRILPWAAAFITICIVSDAIYDLATMTVSRSFAFFFTPWFFLLDVGAVLGLALGMSFGKWPFWQRAAVNFTYLLTCLLLTLIVKRELMT